MSQYSFLAGQPCQVAVGEALCGEPSQFMYFGIKPETFVGAAKSTAYVCNIIMCPDHAKSIAHDFSWQARDSKVRIERLDIVKHRLHCTACGNNMIVMWDDAPQGDPGELAYCARCGSRQQLYHIDAEADYWELMSQSLDGMPIQLVQMLYQEWPRNRYQRFFDYARAAVEHFDATGELPDEDN